ncbi:BnaC03g75080D [Brassica napus]|uniref:BnaC03g75080D protein n=1 Tax=Brassica napus TaxID=3708 RepID=A0A078HL88_BRANA|nr:BnaC03g75080D [Brassica napus]
MSSKRKSSTKSHHDRSIDAYWAARGEVKPPVLGLWVPSPFKTNPLAGCPSKSCSNGLAAVRRVCKIPESVEFRLPEAEEVARDPSEGYFTCYEAYLMLCHLWFPIPELIVQLLDRFNLSISQVNPCGLQHLIGILVLSYDLGITLDADHLDAWVEPRWSSSLIVKVRPRPSMAIISGFASKYHYWKEHFFFVCVSDASVEASAIAVFSTRWGQRVSTTHYRVPEGLLTVRELLRGRLCFWANFTPRRIRRALSPDNILKDYLDSQAGGSSSDQFNLEGLFEFDFPLTKGGPSKVLEFAKAGRMGFLMINRALDTSKQEADMARFKPEVADKEISLLKDELESSRRREGESFEKEVNHAYRRGKREVVEVMKKRRDNFSQKFGEIKEHYKALADYRECRGTVGGLYLTQLLGYSYEGGYARQTVRLAEKDTNFAISEAEEKICEQWDPVPISPDTVEAETGDLGETGEVNQPVAPLDVNDYSIGRSVSGNFDLGD